MVDVSVIIPTYGTPIFLDKAIQSVLCQSFIDFELIIVDDNDPDTEARALTENVVQKYLAIDSRVNYLKHDKNMNGAVARNTGIAIAQGKYISLLDSDDEYVPGRLKKCFDEMEASCEKVAGVYTGCEFRKSGVVYNRFTGVKSGNFLVETLSSRFMFCTGSNFFVRKIIVDELHGFDGAFLRHQDYEFLVRVFEKYTLVAIPEIYVIKNVENFNFPNLNKLVEIKKQYLNKFAHIINGLPKDDVNKIMHGNWINIAENASSQWNFKIANEYYNKARRYGSLSLMEWVRRFALPIFNRIRR